MSIAVQTAVGAIGSKATTELSYKFMSMINAGDFQYGLNRDGIYLLNQGEKDDGESFVRSVTFATTDFGNKNPKRVRSIHFGFVADHEFTLGVKIDDQPWRTYPVIPRKEGLQRIRVPVGRKQQGGYVTIRIESRNSFRIDMIAGIVTVRTTGITGY